MRLYYTLTTIDPVIISQDNSTTNTHQCLDYIPGSAMLGVLASEYYQHFSAQTSWRVFHSGQCRFSPCYPVLNRELCLPIPASWHFEKGQDIQQNNQLNTQKVSNHAAQDFLRQDKVQYQQCRQGYLNKDGGIPEIKQGLITKTAVDSARGIAKESSLFSLSYIEANQTFCGWIDSDNADNLAQMQATLNQVKRIGRSRNNEFGRVQLTVVDVEQSMQSATAKQTTLWCLSDCELIDAAGFPCLSPQGEQVHPSLSGLTLNRHKSFIRTNKVRRFNQHRQALDSEQLLIAKGSVLVFDGECSAPVITAINEQGIGLNKQQGLGWVMVNPSWANYARLPEQLFTAITVNELSQGADSIQTQTPLTQWINEQQLVEQASAHQQRNTDDLLKAIVGYYRLAREYHNILNHLAVGPSANQWRRIFDTVRHAHSGGNWQQDVFVGEGAICKPNNDELGWGVTWHDGHKMVVFADKVATLLAAENTQSMRLLLEKLCRYDLSTYAGLNKTARPAALTEANTQGAY